MPVIDVSMLSGRTTEQKRALCDALTEATCKALGVEPSSVTVILKDIPHDSWMHSGTMMSERKR